MPGVLSNIFDGSDESARTSEQSLATDAGQDIALSPTITLETGGSYEELDGSTTQWENTTVVGVDLNVSATLETATTLTGTTFDEG